MELSPGSLIGGRFRIVQTLGHGGMGVVYRAEDVQSGAQAALKSLVAARPEHFGAIRREINALASLEHPGVVRIVSQGLHEGLPWYAMHYVAGQTLRDRFIQNVAIRSELPAILHVGDALARTLAYLHGQGFVHHDLKPENVILDGEGNPIIIDFGLSTETLVGDTRERIAQEAALPRGTVQYMAPEVIRNDAPDARADIYALGCMLYELIVGRPPFDHSSPVAVLWHHVNAPAPMLHESIEDVAPALDGLLEKMLAKDPHERTPYATDVATTLRTLCTASAPRANEPKTRSYLYRARMADRTQPLEMLRMRIAGMAQGLSFFTLFSGASGAGKTRLLTELLSTIDVSDAYVVTSSTPDAGASQPFGIFAGLLHLLLEYCESCPFPEDIPWLATTAPLLAPYEPGFAAFTDPRTKPPRLGPAEARLHLYKCFAAALEAFCVEHPLVMVLDDLHQGDDLAVGFLVHLARTLVKRTDNRLGIVGTYHKENASAALEALAAEPALIAVHLDALDTSATERMVADMLACSTPPSPLVEAARRGCGGNPLFITEYLRMAVDRGLLQRTPAGQWRVEDALPAPESLERLVGWRVSGLSAHGRTVAETAAAMGQMLEVPVLFAACAKQGLDQGAVETAMVELTRRSILEECTAGMHFPQATLRSLIYDGIAPDTQRALHLAIADAIEEGHRQELEAYAAMLAGHCFKGCDLVRSARYHLMAARRFLRQNLYAEAEYHYEGYLSLQDHPSPEALVARLDLADQILFAAGRHGEAATQYDAAVAAALALDDKPALGRGLLGQITVDMRTGQLRRAMQRCDTVREVFVELGDVRSQGDLMRHVAYILWSEGRLQRCLEVSAATLPLYHSVNDIKGECALLSQRALIYWTCSKLNSAVKDGEDALALARQIGDTALEASILARLACIYWKAGRSSDAQSAVDSSLVSCRRHGMLRSEAVALWNVALVALAQDRLDDALPAAERAYEIIRVGNDMVQGIAAFALVEVLLALKRYDRARQVCDEVLNVYGSAMDKRYHSWVHYASARVERLRQGDRQRAPGDLAIAEAIFKHYDDACGLVWCLCERGHLAIEDGQTAAIRGLKDEAQHLLQRCEVSDESYTARVVEEFGARATL